MHDQEITRLRAELEALRATDDEMATVTADAIARAAAAEAERDQLAARVAELLRLLSPEVCAAE